MQPELSVISWLLFNLPAIKLDMTAVLHLQMHVVYMKTGSNGF